ncbi:MAG: tetratricopeptide repeat protein [Gammaproteobacteria bacterium]|nr:tetratricopeptide repeat protein [Gammaproteobacteria bacterium]MCP5136252.1 tetratricopeptide repeat protein [Gammaproteobacteria bacterium]
MLVRSPRRIAASSARWLRRLGLSVLLTLPLLTSASVNEIRALIDQKQYQQALDMVILELAVQPNSVPLRLMHGVALAKLGELEQAAQVFQELIADNPDDPQMFNNLAAIYASQGAYKNAEDMLQRALLLSPEYSVARANLGDLYLGMAKAQYAEALRTDSDNRGLHARLQALDAMYGVSTAPAPKSANPGSDHHGKNVVGSALIPANGDIGASQPLSDCFLVGPFLSADERRQMQLWLERQGAQVGLSEQDNERVLTRVFMPPVENERAARDRLTSLKSQGMHDVALITTGELRNGISLGVYRNATSVKRRLDQARRAGIEAQSRVESYRSTGPWLLASPANARPIDANAVRMIGGNVQVRQTSCER